MRQRVRTTARALAVCVSAPAFTSCGDDCPGVATCAIQTAITVTITNAVMDGPVPDVTTATSGAQVYSTQCSADARAAGCTVFGDPGVYTLVVSAPGFSSAQRTVTVMGTAGQCGCVRVRAEQVALSLTREGGSGWQRPQ